MSAINTELRELEQVVSRLRSELAGVERRLELLSHIPEGDKQACTPAEAARIRAGLSPFLPDWEDPEMDVYDQYAASVD